MAPEFLNASKLSNDSPDRLIDNDRIPWTCSRAFPAKDAFGRHMAILLLEHDITGTDLNTCQAPGTGILINDKDAVFQMNRILRAAVGTHTALVAKMDAIVTRRRESSLDSQE